MRSSAIPATPDDGTSQGRRRRSWSPVGIWLAHCWVMVGTLLGDGWNNVGLWLVQCWFIVGQTLAYVGL